MKEKLLEGITMEERIALYKAGGRCPLIAQTLADEQGIDRYPMNQKLEHYKNTGATLEMYKEYLVKE